MQCVMKNGKKTKGKKEEKIGDGRLERWKVGGNRFITLIKKKK